MNPYYALKIMRTILRVGAKHTKQMGGGVKLARYFMNNPRKWFQTFFSWHNSAYYKGELVGVAKGIQNTLKQANYLARKQGKSVNTILDEIWKKKKMLDMEYTKHNIRRLESDFKAGKWTYRDPKTNYETPTNKAKELFGYRKTRQELIESSEPYSRVLKRKNPYHNEAKEVYDIQKQDAWTISGFGQDKSLLDAVNINQSDKVINLIAKPNSRMTIDLRTKAKQDPRFSSIQKDLQHSRNEYELFARQEPGQPRIYGQEHGDGILDYAFSGGASLRRPKGLIAGSNIHEVRFNPSYIQWRGPNKGNLVPNKGNKTVAGHTASVDYSFGQPLYRFFDLTDFTRGPLGKLLDKKLDKVVVTGISR